MRKTVSRHLEELRGRLIVIGISVTLLSVIGIYFSGWFIRILIDNLTRNVPVTFISLMPFEFISTQIKLGVMIGIALAVPVIVYQLARFIRPALRKREQKYIYLSAPVSILMFMLGFAFAYFIFLKIALVFLGNLGLQYGVENYWSIGAFVSTVFMTCIMIGLLFNLPVAAFVLSRVGVLRKEFIANKRVYFYVLAFVVGATITPPDVITQVLLAVPLILLYEVSVLLVR